MRIVIDVRTISDHFPGIGRYTFNLVSALARQVEREELILLSNPALANTRFDIGALPFRRHVRIAATTARPFTVREQVCLPGEFRKLSPAVTHFPYPVVPIAARRPIVTTIHDIIPVRLPQYFSLRHRILYRFSMLFALRATGYVLCLSNATASDLTSAFHVDSSRVIIIPAGVDEAFHPCTHDEVEAVRNAYGLPKLYLLYTGSNKPHKNLPALIDAYARLKTIPLLAIAGNEDSRYPEARRRVDLLGLADRVCFLGSVPEKDLPALYSGALAFVFPSQYEGFGLPPLEAMACGVPVACSDIPSLRETAGDAALFFNLKDPAAIAAAIEKISTDGSLRAGLQERGLRRAAELTWQESARQTLEVYYRAANG
jgi:glycosyltransferase involved in cell wall biosynthesis